MKLTAPSDMEIIELLVRCPRCKAMESLDFDGYHLIPTTHYRQDPQGRIHHICGGSISAAVCEVYALGARDGGAPGMPARKGRRRRKS